MGNMAYREFQNMYSIVLKLYRNGSQPVPNCIVGKTRLYLNTLLKLALNPHPGILIRKLYLFTTMLNKADPNKTDIAVSFRYSLDSKCVSLAIQFK
jgi:hypothetical protein